MRNGATRLGTFGVRSNQVVGAGGWTTGLSLASDGAVMVRTDTHNAFTLPVGATKWVRELKPGINCDASLIDLWYGSASPWGSGASYDAALAPSNSAVRYMVSMGYVWVTQDAGANWTRCTLAQKANCATNESNRMSGRPLAVDPANPAIVFFFAPDGVHYSLDYGATWTSIATATIPAPAAGKRGIVVFGPASTVSAGRTQTIYLFSNDSGLYQTTNAGTAWAAVAGSPLNASHIKVGPNGYVYFGGNGASGGGQFRRFDPAGPTWLAPAGIEAKDIAVNPNIPGVVYRNHVGGGLNVSRDYGATWDIDGTNFLANTRTATRIPWHAWTREIQMSNGGMEYDAGRNRLWVATGIGAFYMDNPPSTVSYGQTADWVEHSNGIENMVTTLLAFNNAGDLGYAMHDRGLMVWPKDEIGNTFAAQHGPNNDAVLQHGGMIDWVPGNPNKWVGCSLPASAGTNVITAWTINRGATWSGTAALKTTSGGVGGGNIVAFDDNRWIQLHTNRIQPPAGQSDKNGVWRTADAGVTWTKCTIGDNEALDFHSSLFISRRIMVGDKFTAGRAFVYNSGDGSSSASNLACKGIWETTDYGVTWTRVKSTPIIGYGQDYYHGKFTQGASANEWYWCGGDNAVGLWRSTDGMAQWDQVTGTDDINGAAGFGEVYAFGVGKAAAGSQYPTLLAAGWRQVTPVTDRPSPTLYGLWISFDNGVTWTRTAQFVDGIFDCPNDMAGCPVTFGRFAIGWSGSGVSLFDYQYTMRLS